ncbi:hypothetical protein EIN_023200 [Entamoeba invadens IP1]|uniref:hypothetical protein n=1 Tax=Entamoeba invadens IP1 TaxID=370355 RepID=UPI0002C3F733|nr:hypothetical protein EIN_023200 [Entamoeba invadens IP1]ELP90651.1 hypothetical protein EIN_023200 [Entamoeba invadens IP1]|eukprot:XP_004257422.1 hypothetical protein EIN_023200 [Entamoeba invadens IP1]
MDYSTSDSESFEEHSDLSSSEEKTNPLLSDEELDEELDDDLEDKECIKLSDDKERFTYLILKNSNLFETEDIHEVSIELAKVIKRASKIIEKSQKERDDQFKFYTQSTKQLQAAVDTIRAHSNHLNALTDQICEEKKRHAEVLKRIGALNKNGTKKANYEIEVINNKIVLHQVKESDILFERNAFYEKTLLLKKDIERLNSEKQKNQNIMNSNLEAPTKMTGNRAKSMKIDVDDSIDNKEIVKFFNDNTIQFSDFCNFIKISQITHVDTPPIKRASNIKRSMSVAVPPCEIIKPPEQKSGLGQKIDTSDNSSQKLFVWPLKKVDTIEKVPKIENLEKIKIKETPTKIEEVKPVENKKDDKIKITKKVDKVEKSDLVTPHMEQQPCSHQRDIFILEFLSLLFQFPLCVKLAGLILLCGTLVIRCVLCGMFI